MPPAESGSESIELRNSDYLILLLLLQYFLHEQFCPYGASVGSHGSTKYLDVSMQLCEKDL